jgi:heterodisulfide reductase subunit C
MNKESTHPAFEKAANLLRDADLDEICRRTGAGIRGNTLSIDYFGERVEILLPDIIFRAPQLNAVDQLIILHYLTSTGSAETNGEYVGFKDLPGGMFYYKTFVKQGPDRILKTFGESPEKIFTVSRGLGGKKASFGDASITLKILPHMEVLIVLYRDDGEFPQEAYMLFKDNIINFLSLKDISMLAGEIAGRLHKMEKTTLNEIDLLKADKDFKNEIASRPGAGFFRRCFSCGTCTASCPISEIDENFNPRLIIRQCLLGLREQVLSSKELWFCIQCYTCYARCPQDVRFTDVMAVLREMAIEEGYAPIEMGEKAKKIGDLAQRLRYEITEYAWQCAKGNKQKDIPKKLKDQLEEGLKELE